jgi:hypothetical protein
MLQAIAVKAWYAGTWVEYQRARIGRKAARMTARSISLAAVMLTLIGIAACGGGGNKTPVVINNIVFNPGTVAAGSVIELSANTTGAALSDVKTWTVSSGQLAASQPDFSFVLRGTAKAASSSSLSTTNSKVYWVTPTTGGSATVSLSIGSATRSQNVSIGASLVTMELTDAAGGKKVATVRVNGVTDLYQAAFRVLHTSAWQAESVQQGDFLGNTADTLFLGLTNQSGFVPVAITRKGNVAGVDGSGTLARITFAPRSASSAREASSLPFDIGLVQLRDSQDRLIPNN